MALVTEKMVAEAMKRNALPREVAALLNAAMSVAASAAKVKSELKALHDLYEAQYEAQRKDIQRRLDSEQKACPHLSSTHHPDPSGNSDSYYECDHCGKTM